VPQHGDGSSIPLTRGDITDLVWEVVRSLTPTIQGASNTPSGTSEVTETSAASHSGTSNAIKTHTQVPASIKASAIPGMVTIYLS